MTNWSYQAVNLHVILHVKIGQVNISFIRLYLLCMKFTRHFIIDKMERYIFPFRKPSYFDFRNRVNVAHIYGLFFYQNFDSNMLGFTQPASPKLFNTIQVIHAFDTCLLFFHFDTFPRQVLIIWILLLTVNIS